MLSRKPKRRRPKPVAEGEAPQKKRKVRSSGGISTGLTAEPPAPKLASKRVDVRETSAGNFVHEKAAPVAPASIPAGTLAVFNAYVLMVGIVRDFSIVPERNPAVANVVPPEYYAKTLERLKHMRAELRAEIEPYLSEESRKNWP